MGLLYTKQETDVHFLQPSQCLVLHRSSTIKHRVHWVKLGTRYCQWGCSVTHHFCTTTICCSENDVLRIFGTQCSPGIVFTPGVSHVKCSQYVHAAVSCCFHSKVVRVMKRPTDPVALMYNIYVLRRLQKKIVKAIRGF